MRERKELLFGARSEIVMEAETEERTKPIAIFMAFGTRGDVYPIAVRPSLRSLFPFGCSEAFLSYLSPRIFIFSLVFSATNQRVNLVQVYK